MHVFYTLSAINLSYPLTAIFKQIMFYLCTNFPEALLKQLRHGTKAKKFENLKIFSYTL